LVRALVPGGYGAVGAEVVSELRAGGDDSPVAGRDPARADRVVDFHEPGGASYRAALASVDVVVNAAGVEDPAVAAIAAERGAAFVDITATSAYVAALELLRPRRPVLVSVGLAPRADQPARRRRARGRARPDRHRAAAWCGRAPRCRGDRVVL